MSSNEPTQRDEMARRLRGLRSTNVDVAAFDQRLRESLPLIPDEDRGWKYILYRFLTPAYAVAASFLVIGLIVAGLMILSGQPAVASPQRMAEVYQSAVGMSGHSTAVRTIDEAKEAIRRTWPGAPDLPEPSDMRLMSCCVHEIGRKQMACVTFEVDDQPVTLAMASSHDIRVPKGTPQNIDGRNYLVGSAQGVNMVMSESEGKWRCLMGRLSLDRLARVASSLAE